MAMPSTLLPAPWPSRLLARPWPLKHPATWLVGVVLILGIVGLKAYHPALPEGVEVEWDIVYRTSGDRQVCLDLYRPAGRPPAGGWPVIVAIHGGGWRGGSKDEYGRDLARLTQHGLAVAAIDYRLSRPSQPSWPENLEDARAAVRWLRSHAKLCALDPDRIAALGASAGGHLATLLGTLPADDSCRVAAVIGFYGPADLRTLARVRGPDKAIATMLGTSSDRAFDRFDDASPIRHVTPDDPPMLLLHGDHDRTVPPDQSARLASALSLADVPHRRIVVAGAGHGFGLKVGNRDLLPEILAFLSRTWDHTH